MQTGELLSSVNEIGLLELQGRLSLYINSIYERTEGANISDERKQMNYELIRLLSDSKKKITELAEDLSKKELRNFKYISHIQKLEKELETLKNNL